METLAFDGISMPADIAVDTSSATLLRTPVSSISGVGPKRVAALAERGIKTLEDVLLNLPSRYQDWRDQSSIKELKLGMNAAVSGVLAAVRDHPLRRNRWRRMFTARLDADGATLDLVWFNLPGYMRGRLPEGKRVTVFGRVTESPEGTMQIVHPELRVDDDGAPLEPGIRAVYRTPAEIPQRLYQSLVMQALARAHSLSGAIPDAMRREHGIVSLGEALRAIHQPPDDADIARLKSGRSTAHQALAIDELFAFELAMCIERERSARRAGLNLDEESKLSDAFVDGLGFELTRDQRTAIDEIRDDLESARQMNRILIGDVGSGKTAVAFWAAIRAIECGAQVAMMAPTEILAEQHLAVFRRLCDPLRIESAILTGRTAADERRKILDGLSRGTLPIVFGTHALIREKVRIAKLGLGIIDEQHRFGVFDRARLKALGSEANVLMMTATPIPRSLAMVLFANLDVSILAEMPPGRVPIHTEVFDASEIDRVDKAVADEIAAGRRAYYVAPLIVDNDDADGEASEAKSVEAVAARLKRGRLNNARIATIHGRMRAGDKDAAMRAFRAGNIDVLVSTTVIEVGIDVPEASAIVIVAAERYGLAQLHQLRGRVGRGVTASRCFLVKSVDADENSSARLEVMTRCARGDEIAQADLDMRGPGDLLGARQSGALPLRYISYVRDAATIRLARDMAERWLASDPRLEGLQSRPARAALKAMLALGFSLADVG